MNRTTHPIAQWLAQTNVARRIDGRPAWSYDHVARKLRTHPSLVSHWFSRRRPMPVAYARRVETLTGGAVTYARIVQWEEGR